MAADRIRFSEEDVNTIIKNLKSVHTSLSNAAGGLKGIGITRSSGAEVRVSGSATVSDVIAKNCSLLNRLGQDADDLRSSVSRVRDLFLSTERELSGKTIDTGRDGEAICLNGKGNSAAPSISTLFSDVTKWVKEKTEKKAPKIFDDEGMYGGDQSSAEYDYSRYGLYAKIVSRNTGKNYTEENIGTYLKKMANEGCGYMAMVNAIFQAFENAPEKFQQKFGFPMINPNTGDFDYDRLMVEIYSCTDNRFSILGWELYNKYNDYDKKVDGSKKQYDEMRDTTGRGTNVFDLNHHFEYFLKKYGVEGSANTIIHVTPKNFEKQAKKGSIAMLTGNPFYLYDASGKKYTFDGGHWMTVTGVDSQGRYIVSSWGEEYYVYPRGKEPDGKKCGTMHFSRFTISEKM